MADENETEKQESWCYAFYDVDKNEDDDRVGLRRMEVNGSVNEYYDNGDDGHSHVYYESDDDEEPSYIRVESNSSRNPESSDEIKGNKPEGCYLTTACMQNQAENFDDKCYQLETLRWFRDKYVSKEDKAHYYKVAPTIVAEVDKHPMKNVFYSYIYTHLVDRCVHLIENKEYNLAYDVYKSSVQNFEKRFIHNENKNELEK